MLSQSSIVFFLSNSKSHSQIRQIQAHLITRHLQFNATIGGHFISAAHSLGLLSTAHDFLFVQNPKPHVFLCNSLIRAFAHSRIPHFPFSIYAQMHRNAVSPNNYTFPFLFKSLADFKDTRKGVCIHTHVVKLGHLGDVYVGNSLLSLYGGEMGLCRKLFDEMPERDVVSWTVLISGYRNARKYEDALLAFEWMQYAGVEPNQVTMVNALAACAKFRVCDMGVWIHGFIRRKGWELDVVLGTALIDMYGRCGKIEEGMDVFYGMKEKNVFTWNTVIRGLAVARKGNEAVSWFYRMEHEGFEPDEVTLLEVFSACDHPTLLDTGKEIFNSLVDGKYRFSPSEKHYACMIRLFAGAGCLEEAFRLIREMPFVPTEFMWISLRDGSRAQGNLVLCEIAARKLLEMEEDNSKHYVVLFDIYAEMGRWNDAENVSRMMKEKGFKLDDGCSSVELESSKRFSEALG